ncbi:MAG: hypothetical protein AAB525_04535, partial [Patescibacteria group bacterium]
QLLVEYGLLSLIMFSVVLFSAIKSVLTDVYVDLKKYANNGFQLKSLTDFLPFLSLFVFLLVSLFQPPTVLIFSFWVVLMSLIRLHEEKIYRFN